VVVVATMVGSKEGFASAHNGICLSEPNRGRTTFSFFLTAVV